MNAEESTTQNINPDSDDEAPCRPTRRISRKLFASVCDEEDEEILMEKLPGSRDGDSPVGDSMDMDSETPSSSTPDSSPPLSLTPRKRSRETMDPETPDGRAWSEEATPQSSPLFPSTELHQDRRIQYKRQQRESLSTIRQARMGAPGFLTMRSNSEDTTDDERNNTMATVQRPSESSQSYEDRLALEKQLRRSNKRFAQAREEKGNFQDFFNLITQTQRKNRVLAGGDRTVDENGAEVSSEEINIDIIADQKRQLREAIQRLGLRLEEKRYQTTEVIDGKEITSVVSKNLYYVKGMRTALMDHQIIGVDWMVNERELSRTLPSGGLLFDAMGLGKTIQCIATMCQNPPPPIVSEAQPKITLIVCPLALLQQWKREIQQHAERGKFKVSIHHGKDRIKTPKDLRKRQVVITTYHTVLNGFPKIKVPEKIEKEGDVEAYIAREFRRRCGVLFKVNYWRIIFDESHVLRNRETRMSEAAMNLSRSAENCWCLTGTPIFNNLWDLYPAFSIIRMPGLQYEDRYKKVLNTSCEPEKAIQVSLGVAMIRRTKDDVFLGEPLIKLPPKEVQEIPLKFDPDSRAVYDTLEDLARARINKYSKRGRLRENMNSILLLLLRLRQLCNHPYLTSYELKSWGRPRLQRCISLCDKNYAAKFGKKALLDSTATSTHQPQMELLDDDDTGKQEPKPETGSEHEREHEPCPPKANADKETKHDEEKTQKIRTRPIRDLLVCLHAAAVLDEEEDEDEGEEGPEDAKPDERRLQSCLYCEDEVFLPVVTRCGHVYCRSCIEEAIFLAANKGREYPCDACGKVIQDGDPEDTEAIVLEGEDEDPEEIDLQQLREENRKYQAKIDAEFKVAVNTRFFVTKKLKALKKQLYEWRQKRPDQKIVLFAQATKFLDIIQKVIDDEDWNTTRYQGDMDIAAREESLAKFKNDPQCWIMLTSTKAGGVGLNLTHANLVVSMDLWWNAAIELQAFDRVHRLGQEKDVVVIRYVMEGSVEDRMLELQKNKLKMAGMALGEEGYRIGRLTQKELLGLFGAVRMGKKGRLIVSKD